MYEKVYSAHTIQKKLDQLYSTQEKITVELLLDIKRNTYKDKWTIHKKDKIILNLNNSNNRASNSLQ